jgi:hypothetical protein
MGGSFVFTDLDGYEMKREKDALSYHEFPPLPLGLPWRKPNWISDGEENFNRLV